MCGIFGYLGPRPKTALLVDGIRRLEYRGYDSWGLCIGDVNALHLFRRAGRISTSQVGDSLHEADLEVWGGVAHTRWATHGAPTERNAHPHPDCAGRIAVVHNGIIENHEVLRSQLVAQGHRFASETDTEVIAHLIEEIASQTDDFHQAFVEALKLLEGTYGLAVMNADSPGRIFTACNSSPIVLGLKEDETILASDAAAIVPHTRDVVYLEDREAAVLRAGGFDTLTLDGDPVRKTVYQIAFDLPAIQRGGHPHFMLKEIYEQPEAVRNAFRGRIVRSEGTVRLGGIPEDLLRRSRRCRILACGTSWHAGLIGKYLLEHLASLPTEVSNAAEFRYSQPVLEPDTMVLAISQSGETADTLAGIREAKLKMADTVGICNVVGSTIARECGRGAYIHVGPEIGVASTKAFVGQLTVLLLLALNIGRMRNLSLLHGIQLIDSVERLPDQIEQILQTDAAIHGIAEQYAQYSNILYIGRLYEYPVALEGALKLKEISYIHAEGLQAAELKHGPIALIDERTPTVAVTAQKGVAAKMRSNMEEIRARGGRILAVTSEGDSETQALADDVIEVPSTLDQLVPILSVIPLQLLAYHIGVLKGCDVDKPRNLAKSVTVE